MSRTITVTRDLKLAGAASIYNILVDGALVGKLKAGETVTATVDESAHTLTFDTFGSKQPATVRIPAGGESYTFRATLKVGLLHNQPQLEQTSVTAPPKKAAEKTVSDSPLYNLTKEDFRTLFEGASSGGGKKNELDDYRPGGSKYTPLQSGQQVSSYQTLEENLIAVGTALYMKGYLDPSTPQNQTIAQQSEELFGAPLRNIRIRLTLQQGKFVINEDYYSSEDYAAGTLFHSDTSERTFDFLVNVISQKQLSACSAPQHDLDHIYNMALTIFAEEHPAVWMNDGYLYNQMPC